LKLKKAYKYILPNADPRRTPASSPSSL